MRLKGATVAPAPDAPASPESDLECCICRELMSDPVVLTETGQPYDGHCIRLWFLMGGKTCPLTGVKVASHATHADAGLTAAAAAARAAAGDADADEWWKPALAALPAVTVRVDGGGRGKRPASADAAARAARGGGRRRPWTACLARAETRGSDGESGS